MLQVIQDFPGIVCVPVEHWRTSRCQEYHYTVIKQAVQHIIYKTMEGCQSIEETKWYHRACIWFRKQFSAHSLLVCRECRVLEFANFF